MSQNRAQRLEMALRAYGGKATLAQLLDWVRSDGGLVYKFSASVSELRDELKMRSPAMTVVCHKGKTQGENVYSIEHLLELFQRAA
mgnify:CR=1 FL=1